MGKISDRNVSAGQRGNRWVIYTPYWPQIAASAATGVTRGAFVRLLVRRSHWQVADNVYTRLSRHEMSSLPRLWTTLGRVTDLHTKNANPVNVFPCKISDTHFTCVYFGPCRVIRLRNGIHRTRTDYSSGFILFVDFMRFFAFHIGESYLFVSSYEGVQK